MANALYDKGRDAFLNGGINWGSDDIRAMLVTTGGGTPYVVNLATHQYASSVPSGARVAVMGASLANKSSSSGVADADDVTFSAVPSGTVNAVVIYKRASSDDTTNPLIAYLDSATGIGLTANGGDLAVSWDNGSSKIFKL